MENNWITLLSITFKQSSQICDWRPVWLDATRCCVLTKLLPNPVRSKAEPSCPPKKSLNCPFFFPSFNVKMPASSDKTAATATSTLISLAATHSSFFFLVFSGGFSGQSLLTFASLSHHRLPILSIKKADLLLESTEN